MKKGKDRIIIKDLNHPCLRCVWCRIEDGTLYCLFPQCFRDNYYKNNDVVQKSSNATT